MADQNFRVKRGLEVGIGGTVITATASGSVGIGTTNPTVKLEVLASASGAFGISTAPNLATSSANISNSLGDAIIYLSNDDRVSAGLGTLANNGSVINFNGKWDSAILTSNRTFGAIGAYKENNTSANQQGYLSLYTRPSSGNLVERVRITSTGNVGIGTTNPGSLLQVQGNVLVSGVSTFVGDGSLANPAIFARRDSGNTAGIKLFGSSGGNYVYSESTTSNPKSLIIDSAQNKEIYIRIEGDTKVAINTTGELLVGVLTATGTASQTLQVTGGAYVSGNLGIGTTNPQSALSFGPNSVISAATIDGSDNTRLSISGGGDATTTRGGFIDLSGNERSTDAGSVDINSGNVANSYVRIQGRSSTSDIRFWIGAAEAARFDSDRRLGIGTTNPTAKLEPVDTAANPSVAPVVFIQRPNNILPASIAPTNADLRIKSHSSNVKIYAEDHSANPLMILTGGGNLGIGTTNPTAKLQVATGPVIIGTATSTGTASQTLQVTGGAYFSGSTGVGATLPFTESSTGTFTISGSAVSKLYFEDTGYEATGAGVGQFVYDNGNLSWLVGSRNGSTTTASSELFRVLEGGNVGIGTTNPTSKLEILDGPAGTAGQLRLITPGDVGVANSTVFLRLNDKNGNAGYFGFGGAINQLDIWNYKNGPIRIGTNSVEAVRVSAGGSVGIGTNNPTSKLHVIGSIKATTSIDTDTQFLGQANDTVSTPSYSWTGDTTTGFYRPASGNLGFTISGTERLRLNTTGVGIGTTNPTAALTIATVGSATTGASQIYLNGSTSNRIDFNTSGGGAPAFITRSVGTKIVLYPSVTASNVDYAFGIESSALWSSVSNSGASFKWYGGTTELARLRGDGNLGIGTTNPASKLDVRGSISIGRTDAIGINSIRSVTDINSWEHYGVSFYVGGEDTTPTDIYFKDDGTKMFILGDTGNDVNEYALSTAWDLTTAGFTTNYSVAAEETNPNGLYFKPDGTVMYICGQTGVAPLVASGDYVHQYTLGTAWDISNTGGATVGWTTSFRILEDTAPQGVYLKNDDGTKMYVLGSTNDRIYEYALGTAWNVSTAGFTTSILIGTGTTQNLPLTITAPLGIDFNSSGTKMYITGNGRDLVTRFDLSTPWDITTATFFDNVYVGFQELNPSGIFYQEDQSKAYIVGYSGDRVYQYNTDVPSLELASSGISTRSSIILNNEARLNNRLYVTSDAHFSSPVTLKSTLQVDSSIVTSSNLTVSGGTITAGNVAASLLTGNTTTNISFATAQTTGTFTLGNTAGTGTITLGRATTSQQTDIQAGASGVGTTKTINLGTGGLSGSTTRINIGPTAGDGVIFIGAGTSIGIGTANPETPLNINSTSTGLKITRDNQSFSVNANYGGQNHCAFELTNALSIRTGAGAQNERVRIDSSGNVGIGTTNPGEKLQVNGNVRVGISTTSNYIAFRGTTGDNPGIYDHTYVGERIWDPGSERSELLLFKGNDADVNSGPDRIRLAAGEIRFDTYTTATSGSFEGIGTSANITNKVIITGIGSVGIGTTNPQYKTHIVDTAAIGAGLLVQGGGQGSPIARFERTVGTSGLLVDVNASGSDPQIVFNRVGFTTFAIGLNQIAGGTDVFEIASSNALGTNTRFVIDSSNGNVGIGTTNPSTLLHLHSTDPTIRLKRSDASTNAYGEITSDTSGLITLKSDPGNAATNSGFSLTVDNIERVRVGSAGSVGIGITNATSRLYVLGDLASEYAATFFNDGNNANRFGIKIQCGVDTGSGTAIAINDGDGTNQGNVTFNAGTVTYGAFTANHDCVIPSYSQEIPYGSLMIVNKILYKKRIDGTEMERGIIYESGISTLPYVKNLLGAYSYQYDPDSPMQQAVDLPLHQVLVLGDGHIRCCNENGNIKIGDGITSSSMEGVGMKMNKIGMVIGIAQEDVDFTDANEVKLVPVQYGLHQYIPDNISEYLETLINQ